MDIRNFRELKATAVRRLDQARDSRRLILIYAVITVAASLLSTAISYLLDLQVNQHGGLSNLGTRSLLSTISTFLPIVTSLALMCLELGFLAATLRIGREMYTSPQTLRAGIPRFGAMIRCSLLLMGLYFLAGMAAAYLSTMIYVMTPLSNQALELMLPLMEDMSVLSSDIAIDDATAFALLDAMIPYAILFGLVYFALVLPLSYRYRMANLVLLHDPAAGAIKALGESKKMMRGNCFTLFRLDLSMWWYYALQLLAMLICYGDNVLGLLGITLPLSETASFFLFYGAFLLVTFCIHYFLRARVEVTYALVFDSIRPKDQETTDGVVLGNIFQM